MAGLFCILPPAAAVLTSSHDGSGRVKESIYLMQYNCNDLRRCDYLKDSNFAIIY